MNSGARKEAIQLARQWISKKPVYIDTETTGTGPNDGIIEISVIDHDGSVLVRFACETSRENFSRCQSSSRDHRRDDQRCTPMGCCLGAGGSSNYRPGSWYLQCRFRSAHDAPVASDEIGSAGQTQKVLNSFAS